MSLAFKDYDKLRTVARRRYGATCRDRTGDLLMSGAVPAVDMSGCRGPQRPNIGVPIDEVRARKFEGTCRVSQLGPEVRTTVAIPQIGGSTGNMCSNARCGTCRS